MAIMLKRKNGKVRPFRNVEYLPAYYFIPQSVLEQCGAEVQSIPRNPQRLIHDEKAIAVVESDLFMLLMMDAYAFMVWPFMGNGEYMEIYSGHDPAWIFAHSPAFWVQEMIEEGVIPKAEDLFRDGATDTEFGFVSEEEIFNIFSWLVPQVMARHKMYDVMKIVEAHRDFKDFDFRKSRQKTDLFRKWYHTRSEKVKVDSLEQMRERQYKSGVGKRWDVPDPAQDLEEQVLGSVQAEQFMATLTEKDRQILNLRVVGYTLEEIAEKLDYKNHSGVLKRIRKIGEAYEKFAGVDLGF